MLSRILVAVALAAAAVSGAAVAFLRTDFVANNLCAYAVATIEEATAAQVQVARCSVLPEQGMVTIEGLHVGAPGGRLDLKVARVFAQVTVRPLLQKLKLARLEIDHPELHLALDQAGGTPAQGGRCLPDVLDRFEFGRVHVRKAAIEVKTSGMRVSIPRLALLVKGRGGPLSVKLATRGGTLELPGRGAGLVSTRVTASVDLRGQGSVDLKRADLVGEEASAFLKGSLKDLCDPQIDLFAKLRVDDLESASARLLPGALRNVKGGLSADVAFSLEKGRPQVKGDLQIRSLALESFSPGDARLHFDVTPARVRVDHLNVPVGRGQVTGSVEVSLASAALPVSADLGLRDMELQELLRKLGLAHAWVVMRTSGRVQARGTLVPFQLAAEPVLDLAEFAVLDRSYDERPRKGAAATPSRMFEFAAGRLTGAVDIDKSKIVLRNGSIDAGRSHMAVESTFFTDLEAGMRIAARSERLELDDFRGHIGPIPAQGSMTLTARVDGPYRALSIEGSVSARDFRFLDLALGDLSTQAAFDAASLRLSLAQIRGHKDRSTYQGRLALDFAGAGTPVDTHLELPDAYLHDLVELAIGLVPSLSPLRDPEDVDGRLSAVIDVKGPVGGPEGTASLQLGAMRLWGEAFEGGSAAVSLHGAEPRLQVHELSLRHGQGRVRAAGSFGPEWKLDFDAATESLTLADLDMARAARLEGPLRASAHVGGVSAHPLVSATARFSQGKAGKAELGEGDLSLRIDGRKMTWKGAVGTHALSGEARLEDDFPYTCTASLRVPDLAQVLELLAPDAQIQRGTLAAGVELRGSLLRWRESEGTMTLSQLQIVRSEMEFESDGVAEVSFGPAGVHIERLVLRAPWTTAQLSGGSARGRLDLRLTASVDGRVLQGLLPDVEHASGTYLVQASVGGTLKEPTVLGNARIEDGAVTLRGLPIAARAMNGSISFSQDALVIDSMAGKLNNGEARVSGGMELARMVPKKIDVAAHVSEVNVRLDNVGATVDGDLTLFGPPDEPVLGGSVTVSQLKYAEDLDLERSLLDFSRRPPAPRVLTKSAMLVHFDLDVHLGRGVRVENNLARADLKGDLKLTGTSRAIGLLGSVNTVHGTASFRGNEFQIEQGVLSFSDRQRIRPSFDFQASTQVKSSNIEYKIHLHAFGTPGEPHLALNCDPALSESDLSFLLTFGFVSTSLQGSASAADSGLAIGIEALNKATGFSEEVRRFIPKNAILRDPNIDFASDFSAATNRLEPMARFQSHLLTDRLDLKVLEGLTTRRYRGVVSYQLSDALSTRLQLDNEHVTSGVGTDFGIDLHLKWEGE